MSTWARYICTIAGCLIFADGNKELRPLFLLENRTGCISNLPFLRCRFPGRCGTSTSVCARGRASRERVGRRQTPAHTRPRQRLRLPDWLLASLPLSAFHGSTPVIQRFPGTPWDPGVTCC
jgi:hypothetical protein